MTKYIKTTGITFLLATLFWILSIVLSPATFQLWSGIFAIAFSIVFLCFLVIAICKKKGKSISPYRTFAIVDAIIGLCVLLYALFDIATDTGWFAGLTGMLLLIFVLPINLLLLLIDFLIWKKKNSKKAKK